MIVCLLFFVLKSVHLMSKPGLMWKPGWCLISFKWMKTRWMSYLLLLNKLLACSIFQNSWILVALIFSPSVRNLGVTLDSTLSLHQHVLNVCRVAYLALRRINSIRNLFSVDAVKTLVCSLVLSRLDYCNSLLVGLPHVYTPARSLRSSSDTRILSTPNVKLKSYGQRSFAYHGPTTWNLWKIICFFSINELNTNVVFFQLLILHWLLLI